MAQNILKNPQLAQLLPLDVKKIFEVFLTKEHDSIRLVGGCVRDMLLGSVIKDYDFACKFLPQEIIEILEQNEIKAIPTGIKFGTITAHINGQNYEITTLRKDNNQDGRHCEPEFIDDYLSDAMRRDFTINALYMDFDGNIYDYFSGLIDLRNSEVKFIGDANQRIKEDYLRILRFFRFSARFAAILDNEGLNACIANKNQIKTLSFDRIRNEFYKMFNEANDENLLWILHEIENSQIRAEILPANLNILNLAKLFNINQKLNLKLSEQLKFACLNFPSNKFEEVLYRFNFSNNDKKYFTFLNERLQNQCQLDINDIKALLIDEEKSLVKDLYLLKSLELNASEIKKTLEFINNFSAPKFPVNGQDLIELGLKGKQLGFALDTLKKIWIDADFKISKDELLKMV